ncbi:MAG: hypothetical protein IJ661_03365 [Lachnospiraceae bacterium]|nr:hypothetical protein [Lachnospiraceae bacterium]
MEEFVRYGKPSMTDLPYELGVRIMEQIMNAPKPDFTNADKEIAEITKRIKAAREKADE